MWKKSITSLREKRSVVDIIRGYLFLGKFLGYTIFTVTGANDVQTMDFRFQLDDLLLFVVYLSANSLMLYYGFRQSGDDKENIIQTVGARLVLTMSMVTGIVSSTVIILLRKKLKRMLQLFHEFDSQVSKCGTIIPGLGSNR